MEAKIDQKILECTGSWHDYVIDTLKDKEEAERYLQVALDEYQDDGDTAAFLLALRNIAEAKGGIGKLAKTTDLTRENLYRTLSSNGNPSLKTLQPILQGLGYHLTISSIAH